MMLEPQHITCERCSAMSSQRLADLLQLRATCPGCGALLIEAGRRMQGTADSLNEFFAFVEILLQLEEHLGSSIGDTKDFYDGRMLRDIARVVQLRLPPGPDSEAQSVKVVREAVLKVSREDLKRLQWDSAEEIPLDVPVFLAVYPEQWK